MVFQRIGVGLMGFWSNETVEERIWRLCQEGRLDLTRADLSSELFQERFLALGISASLVFLSSAVENSDSKGLSSC